MAKALSQFRVVGDAILGRCPLPPLPNEGFTMLNKEATHKEASAAAYASLCSRLCQCTNKTISHSAVVATAESKYSQANGSERTVDQCRHASAAGSADGEVRSAEAARLRRSVLSGVPGVLCCMAWVACVASVLIHGPVYAVLAIVLCICAMAALIADQFFTN